MGKWTLGLIMLLGAISAGSTPTARLAKDGAQFPAAADRKIDMQLPVVGKAIGSLPEEFAGGRIYSLKASRDKLPKCFMCNDFEPEWFALDVAGADVVGIKLTDGRISELHYRFDRSMHPKALSMLKEFRRVGDPEKEKKGGGLAGCAQVTVKENPVVIDSCSFDVKIAYSPIEWNISYEQPAAEVCEAMRACNPCHGMTIEQATIIFGEPQYRSASGTRIQLQWEMKAADYRWYNSGRLGGMSGPQYVGEKVVRSVAADFVDGKMTGFSDSSRD